MMVWFVQNCIGVFKKMFLFGGFKAMLDFFERWPCKQCLLKLPLFIFLDLMSLKMLFSDLKADLML